MKLSFGDVLLNEIENNLYFKSLYNEVLSLYGDKIINGTLNNSFSDDKINDILRFADILSKSNVTNKLSFHRNLAQDIVIIMSVVFAHDKNIHEKVSFYEKNIFSTVSNYSGFSKVKGGDKVANNADYFSDFANNIKKEFNRVDGSQDVFYFDSQKKALNMMENMQYYSFSAPTSMGKTFIIKNFLKNKILDSNCRCIVLILPTKALINELEEDLILESCTELNLHNFVVLTIPTQIKLFAAERKILLFTPERMLQALNDESIKDIDYFFVDESQKIFESDERAPLYYKLLEKVNATMPLTKIIFSSPYTENPEILLELINSPYIQNKKELAGSDKFDFTPVAQKQFLIDVHNNKVKVYSQLASDFVNITCNSKITWTGLIAEQTNSGPSIVYCKSKADVLKYANEYSNLIKEHETLDSEILNLIHLVETEINPDYYLIPLLKKGIAFHMGIMPSQVRKKVENLMKNGVLKVVFCTSTLLEGVNLPAVNIFVLSQKKGHGKLSVLEFKNLIGRAGRIKYNLWGNAFLVNLASEDSYYAYKEYLKSSIKENSLNPQVPHRIKEMAPSLFDSEYKIIKKKNESFPNLNKFIMYRNLLLEAVKMNKTNSVVYKHYSKDIEKLLEQNKSLIEFDLEDINDLKFAPEILNDLKSRIINGQIELPKLIKIEDINTRGVSEEDKELNRKIIDSNILELSEFFIKLHAVFQWDKYHSSLDIGSENSLPILATTVSKWIAGQRLSKLIFGKLQSYKRSQKRYSLVTHSVEVYQDTIPERNEVIMEVMDLIETKIKYTLSSYVKKFVELYKKVKKIEIESSIDDYIDYGTMNNVIITLQKIGLSRELAHEIYVKNYFEYASDGKIYIKEKNILTKNDNYKEEMSYVVKNLANLFL